MVDETVTTRDGALVTAGGRVLAVTAVGTDVADARANVTMEYDSVGNRTSVHTTVNYLGLSGETPSSSHRFFQYDSMNRQVVVDAGSKVLGADRPGWASGLGGAGSVTL